jgi:hypothetical protein
MPFIIAPKILKLRCKSNKTCIGPELWKERERERQEGRKEGRKGKKFILSLLKNEEMGWGHGSIGRVPT